MKNKTAIAIVMLVLVIASCAGMLVIFNSVKTPANAQINPTSTPTAMPRVILVSTPRPEWTPVPGWGGLVNYQVMPLKK